MYKNINNIVYISLSSIPTQIYQKKKKAAIGQSEELIRQHVSEKF